MRTRIIPAMRRWILGEPMKHRATMAPFKQNKKQIRKPDQMAAIKPVRCLQPQAAYSKNPARILRKQYCPAGGVFFHLICNLICHLILSFHVVNPIQCVVAPPPSQHGRNEWSALRLITRVFGIRKHLIMKKTSAPWPAPPASPALPLCLARLLRHALIVCGAGLIGAHAFATPAIPDTIAQRVAACTACHGSEGRATNDGYFPRIAGKPAGYLYNQLMNFREGRRTYPLMTYMVNHLSDAYLMEMAEYFESLHAPYPPPQPVNVSKETLERGRRLIFYGDRLKDVPACIACHGKTLTGVAPAIPGLLGMPRDYLNAQFGAWKNGTRKAAAPDCMARITSHLTTDDISAATAWLASQPAPNDMAPLSAPSSRLPLQCGSLP